MQTNQIRARKSREQIIQAALDEFGNQGYENASTNRICRQAGVSKGLLFHYFPVKEDLFLAVLEQCLMDFQEDMRAFPLECTLFQPDKIARFYGARMCFFAKHPNHYRILFGLHSSMFAQVRERCRIRVEEVLGEKRKALQQLLSSCPVRPGICPEQALELVMLMSDSIMRKYLDEIWVNSPGGNSKEAQAMFQRELAQALQMLLYGMVQDKERSRC